MLLNITSEALEDTIVGLNPLDVSMIPTNINT